MCVCVCVCVCMGWWWIYACLYIYIYIYISGSVRKPKKNTCEYIVMLTVWVVGVFF